MSARLKSSVLRREERGFGSVSMGRLIVAGMVGGLCFFAMRVLGMSALMMPSGLVGFLACLIFTSPKHGIPLYLHLLVTLKARFLMDSLAHPHGWTAQMARWLELNAEQITLDSTKLLSVTAILEDDGTLDDWEIVADSAHDAGLEVVSDTLQIEGRG